MAAPVKSTQPISTAPGPSPITAEQKYWRSFAKQLQYPSPSNTAVTHISHPLTLSPTAANTASDLFAVTSGGRLQIFSTRTRKPVKNIARFGLAESAHSGEIRSDGRVVCAGGDSGSLQVFDVQSRAILKTWKEHKQAIHTTKWHPTDLTTLMSTSDDMTVRTWDLPSQDSVVKFTGHQDYVRSGAWMPGQSSGLLVSGSYDQTVRLWDPRASAKAVMTFKHAGPVEDVLALHSGTTILTAADNQVSVLDLVAAKVQRTLRSHQKTVTSLCLGSNGTRVLSGSLDGHVKVFETASWTVVAGAKYSSPVLALDVIPAPTSDTTAQREDRHLAVGLQSGVFSLKTRLTGQQKIVQRQREQEMEALVSGNIEAFDRKKAQDKKRKQRTQGHNARLRGIDYDGLNADIIIDGAAREGGKKTKLQPWDEALRRLEYGKALDLALSLEIPSPTTVLTVLNVLQQRSALRAALKNRNEVTLQPILRWLTKYMSDTRHIVLITRVSMLVLDMYADVVGLSETVDGCIEALHARVREDVDVAQTAWCTAGMLETALLSGG